MMRREQWRKVRVTALWLAWGTAVLAALTDCSNTTAGGGGGVGVLTDAGKSGLPGFDGFAFEVSGKDAVVDSAPEDAVLDTADDALTDDATTDDTDDAAVAQPDVTDSDSADSVNLACAQTCEIDDDCNANTTNPCAATICEMGCCHISPTAGIPCDDGVPCNGPDACKNGICTPALPNGCDDGLPCTFDTCDGIACHHAVVEGWCQIGTTCVQAQASIPGDPCKVCDPAQNKQDWSQLPGCCKADKDCPALGACDKPTCDVAAGQCLIVKIPGCCKSDADCDDGNLCTTDSCDFATGNCTSNTITCTAPSECQSATCDPKDGQCKPDLLPGWCFIDNQCIATGAGNPTNPCQVCQPLGAATAWTSQAGIPCNDNNACTFSDICTAAGICKGTAQPGCCQTDADCSNSGQPCKVGLCNQAVGLCKLADSPGCCTAGVCCDTAAQVVKPLGTPCGSATIGSEYQCSGADIQKRDYTAGCNGSSPSQCTTSMATGAPGDWATVSTCPPGTACTSLGSGVMPACQIQGTCSGACGGTGTYGCKCSADCVGNGTCCPDAPSACGCSAGVCCDVGAGVVLATGTPCGGPADAVQYQCAGNDIQKRTSQGKCVGGSDCSLAPSDVFWSAWQTTQSCPTGCTAAPDGSSASCVALTGSCFASCGVQSSTGNCSCNASCKAQGTCCSDYDVYGCDFAQACGIQGNTCAGSCGGQSGSSSCWCDGACNSIGDCCPDKFLCGCSP